MQLPCFHEVSRPVRMSYDPLSCRGPGVETCASTFIPDAIWLERLSATLSFLEPGLDLHDVPVVHADLDVPKL